MFLSIVIVTYNRLTKLKKTLNCYQGQTQMPDTMIIVDNHSTDGTDNFLDVWQKEYAPFKKIVIHTEENLGGAGGFYIGQKKALEIGSEWVFVADDDAYPDEKMVEYFKKFVDNNDVRNVAAICSSVWNMGGTIVYCHRDYFATVKTKYHKRWSSKPEQYDKDFFRIDLLSYVGSFLNVQALKSVGLVDPNYFIYYDDTEHSMRLRKWGDIVCVPKIKMIHDTDETTIRDSVPIVSWRQYYLFRNELHALRRHYFCLGINTFWVYFRHLWFYHIEPEPIRKVMKDAFIDAFFCRMGKNKKYLPGRDGRFCGMRENIL